MCLISIIIPSFNCVGLLQGAIDDALAQTHGSKQVIVVDGASTDGSVEMLKAYHQRIDWISEPDSGVYDAMNKGIQMARGDWLYFLGTDDRFYEPDVLAKVAALIDEHPARVLVGDVLDESGGIFRSRMDWRTVAINTVHHQSAFYHRSLFEFFRYDTAIRVISDYELNFLCWLRGTPSRKIDLVVARCASTGLSHTTSELRNYRDAFTLRKRHISSPLNYVALAISLANLGRRTLLQRS